MSLPVLVAVPGDAEAALVAGWESCRREVTVVRRCADVADLLATATAGLARAAVVGTDLAGFDAEALAHLRACGVAVVALLAVDDEATDKRWRQLGVQHVLPTSTSAAEVAATVSEAVGEGAGGSRAATRSRSRVADADRARPSPAGRRVDVTPGTGRVLVLWGPHGSTGRTTLAVHLAAELAAAGDEVLLVDADTYGASTGQVLGMLDEAPSLLAAARAATDGRLDVATLRHAAAEVFPGLRVLTGAAAPSRWHELRPSALERILDIARQAVHWVVVDVAACAEQEEESTFDLPALRRNGATLAALAAADLVLVVGAADPVGLQRMVRAWQALPDLAPTGRPLAVANRVRPAAVGRTPERRITEALERFAGVEDPVLLPDDPTACDAVLLQGRTLSEAAPRAHLRRALALLADRVRFEAAPTAP
ncbi:P-loop NTPase [Kineococcus glutinatus]|uniref:P-loop NTPase n=1 Tax=Kineococcus glutinatus TaxID=1070872 RepID=A0ABP9HJ10_9ACTN